MELSIFNHELSLYTGNFVQHAGPSSTGYQLWEANPPTSLLPTTKAKNQKTEPEFCR